MKNNMKFLALILFSFLAYKCISDKKNIEGENVIIEELVQPEIEIKSELNDCDTTRQFLLKKVNKLDSLSDLLENQKNATIELAFFNEFPNCFDQYVEIYGYKIVNGKSIDGLAPYASFTHVRKIFTNVQLKESALYFEKLVKVCVNGYWQADGVNDLKFCLFGKLQTNLDDIVSILITKTDEDIIGFWYFYFDGPHPPKVIPVDLIEIEKKNKRIFDLIKIAHQKVLANKSHHH